MYSSAMVDVIRLSLYVVAIYRKITLLIPPSKETDCVHSNIKLWTGTVHK